MTDSPKGTSSGSTRARGKWRLSIERQTNRRPELRQQIRVPVRELERLRQGQSIDRSLGVVVGVDGDMDRLCEFGQQPHVGGDLVDLGSRVDIVEAVPRLLHSLVPGASVPAM